LITLALDLTFSVQFATFSLNPEPLDQRTFLANTKKVLLTDITFTNPFLWSSYILHLQKLLIVIFFVKSVTFWVTFLFAIIIFYDIVDSLKFNFVTVFSDNNYLYSSRFKIKRWNSSNFNIICHPGKTTWFFNQNVNAQVLTCLVIIFFILWPFYTWISLLESNICFKRKTKVLNSMQINWSFNLWEIQQGSEYKTF
jgi:hypothetical protein